MEENMNNTNDRICSNCGAKLEEDQIFCPKCGHKVEEALENATENVTEIEDAPIFDRFNDGGEIEQPKKKFVLPLVVLAIAVVAVIVVIAVNVSKDSKRSPDFSALYDEYCVSTWAKVGSDGSYLSIDTNPDDEDDKGIAYYGAYIAVEEINAALGLPESLMEDMGNTTSLMGKQSETYSDIGITVSWTYHPDNGLEVTYKLTNS